MKKITKILSMTMLIMFIAIPVLQSLTGKGVVHAETRPRTFTISYKCDNYNDADKLNKAKKEAIAKHVNSEKETVTENFTEYKIGLYFRYTENNDNPYMMEFDDISKEDLPKFQQGIDYTATCSGVGSFKIYLKAGKEKRKINGKYLVTREVASKNVPYWKSDRITNDDLKKLSANFQIKLSDGRNLDVSVRYDTYDVYNEARTSITVSPRKNIAQVNWDAYLKLLYTPIPSQTTYTNSSYNYNNATDSYAVNNVASTINQTITPEGINTYSAVNIHDNGRRLFIRQLCQSLLKREPTEAEYTNYLKKNVQTNAIDIIMSQESENRNHINSKDNEAFVKYIYKAMLCQNPDAATLADYKRLLDCGVLRTAVIKEICESPEFSARWNRQAKKLSFDANTCTAVHKYLSSQPGVQVIKSSNTTICMYADDVIKVKELNIGSMNLKNLNGLSQFSNLETLSASYNKFTDISELAKLTNVKKLILDSCNLKSVNLSSIKSMTKLEELHLENNGLTQSNLVFQGMSSIKKMYLKNNEIHTINAAFLTNNLTYLDLDNNTVINTSPLDYSKLSTISLKNNKYTFSSRGTKKSIPAIVKSAQNKSGRLYATNGVVFNKCKIVGNDLVMDSGVATATVTIKGGPADGTVITLKNLDVAQ